jgi:hypothetical protein
MIDFKDLNEKIAALPASSIGDEVQRIVDNGPSVVATLTAIVSAYSRAYREVQVIQRNADTGELEDVTDSDEFKDRLQIPNNVLATMWANALPAVSILADARRHSHLDETEIQSSEKYDEVNVAHFDRPCQIDMVCSSKPTYGITQYWTKTQGGTSYVRSPWSMSLNVTDLPTYKGMPRYAIRFGGKDYYGISIPFNLVSFESPGAVYEVSYGLHTTDSRFEAGTGTISQLLKVEGQDVEKRLVTAVCRTSNCGTAQQSTSVNLDNLGYVAIRISAIYLATEELSSGQITFDPVTRPNDKLIIEFSMQAEGRACYQRFVALFTNDSERGWVALPISDREKFADGGEVSSGVLPMDLPPFIRVTGQVPATEQDFTAIRSFTPGSLRIMPVDTTSVLTNSFHDKVTVTGSAFDGGNAYKAAYVAAQTLLDFMDEQGLSTGLTDDMTEALNWEFIEE